MREMKARAERARISRCGGIPREVKGAFGRDRTGGGRHIFACRAVLVVGVKVSDDLVARGTSWKIVEVLRARGGISRLVVRKHARALS